MKNFLIAASICAVAASTNTPSTFAVDWNRDLLSFEKDEPIDSVEANVFTFPISRALGNDVLAPEPRYECGVVWSDRDPWYHGFIIADD